MRRRSASSASLSLGGTGGGAKLGGEGAGGSLDLMDSRRICDGANEIVSGLVFSATPPLCYVRRMTPFSREKEGETCLLWSAQICGRHDRSH